MEAVVHLQEQREVSMHDVNTDKLMLNTYSDLGSSHVIDAIHVGEKFGPMTIMILSIEINDSVNIIPTGTVYLLCSFQSQINRHGSSRAVEGGGGGRRVKYM